MSECNHFHTSVSFHYNFKEGGEYHCLPLHFCMNIMYIGTNKKFLICFIFWEVMTMTSNRLGAWHTAASMQPRAELLGAQEGWGSISISVIYSSQRACNSLIFLNSTVWAHRELLLGGYLCLFNDHVCQVIAMVSPVLPCCLSQSICRLKNSTDRKFSIRSRLALKIICVSAFP